MLSTDEALVLAEKEGVGCSACLPGTKQRWFRCPRCQRTARGVRLVLQAQALLEALNGRLCCRSGSATECVPCYEDRALVASIESGSVDDVLEAVARNAPALTVVGAFGPDGQEIQYTGYPGRKP